MLGRDKHKAPKVVRDGNVDTLIAKGVEFRGDLHFSGVLYLDGTVIGNVIADDAKALLTIGAQGLVDGEIRVPNVVIHGEVRGNVHAGAHISLSSEARVSGCVHYQLIEMQMGAAISGQLVHEPAAPALALVDPAAKAAG